MSLKRVVLHHHSASSRISIWAIAFAFALLLHCEEAHAWTDAKVQGVHTYIELSENGIADVLMKIKIRVRGGWLSRFEITGLDDDLVLDVTRPAVIISEEGPRYIPEIKMRETGTVILNFTDRKRVPRRGTYTCELRYTTASIVRDIENASVDKRYVYWSLPPWHVGLENVQIEIAAPLGSRPLALSAEESFVEQRNYSDSNNQTVLQYRRIHLPRTVAWEIGFTLPNSTPASTAPVRSTDTTSSNTTTQESVAISGSWIAVLLGVIAMLKRFFVMRNCRRRRVEPIPLIAPKSDYLRHSLLVLLAFGAFVLFSTNRVTALVLCCLVVVLSIDKTYRQLPVLQKGVWRSVTQRDLWVARFYPYKIFFSFSAWLDATTPLGLALLVSNIILSFLLYWQGDSDFAYSWSCSAILVTPLFLTGTRKDFPLSPEVALNVLNDFVVRTSTTPRSGSNIGRDLLLYQTPSGDWQEARLRFDCKTFTEGLQQLDLVIADFRACRTTDPELALLSVATLGSPADRILNTRLKNASTYSASTGDRVARITRSIGFRDNINGLLDSVLSV